MIGMESFGKDHWSLLGYFETLCVDSSSELGEIDLRKMRCNDNTHPTYYINRLDSGSSKNNWKPEYGTRLKGFFGEGEKRDKSKQIPDHDDWNCFEDLIEAGLVTWEGTGTFPHVQFTKKGLEIAAELRKHKATGGVFAHFQPSGLSPV